MDLVTSDSMSPVLMEGDVVVWVPTDIEDLEIGDIIVFKSYLHWPDEKIVVHRVNDIKHNKIGEVLLETKGDKNKWVDQAGPHVPEPYIREDHVMGKVLSIGQVPLKIPFIGYIGVWVNEGLGSLSQPSQSKGSLDYIGIFAPLTISIVFLVILLFLLPEKAKTFKEKIQLNIFGKKPLKLKRTLISFLIAYMIFLTVIHCFAYDSITSSVGVNANCEDSGLKFGKIKRPAESSLRDLPIINPGTMPVKGVVFGKGEMSEFVERKVFEVQSGQTDVAYIRAISTNESKNGSYYGDLMIYSSPFWLMFPNDLMQNIVNFNAELSIFIFDLLSAFILTTITMVTLILITFIGDTYVIWANNRLWYHSSKLFLKRKTIDKIATVKNNTKLGFNKKISWIGNVDFSEGSSKKSILTSIGKPTIAALLILPIFFLLNDQILAMFIAVIFAGIFAYCISCKVRNKIVLTALITTIVAIIYMVIQSSFVVLTHEHELLEVMALLLGTIGIFLLLFAILITPLALASWAVSHLIRNVKEQKDPLLCLEGRCDL